MLFEHLKHSLGMLSVFIFLLCLGCGGGGSSGGGDDNRSQSGSVTTYSVIATANEALAGSVSGGGGFEAGVTVNLVASANPNYVFSYWAEDGIKVSEENPYSFTVNAGRTLVAMFEAVEPCKNAAGEEHNLTYSWSLSTEEVTLTNNNQCDNIFVWATSTPLCDVFCINDIRAIYRTVAPGESVNLPAGLPFEISWKPDVIFSTANGNAYTLLAKQAGSPQDFHFPVVLLDFADSHTGHIPEYETAFAISDNVYETQRGDCYSFSWLDRENGYFHIAADPGQKNAYCMVGNNTGYTESGDFLMNLPTLWYFVTDRSKGPTGN